MRVQASNNPGFLLRPRNHNAARIQASNAGRFAPGRGSKKAYRPQASNSNRFAPSSSKKSSTQVHRVDCQNGGHSRQYEKPAGDLMVDLEEVATRNIADPIRLKYDRAPGSNPSQHVAESVQNDIKVLDQLAHIKFESGGNGMINNPKSEEDEQGNNSLTSVHEKESLPPANVALTCSQHLDPDGIILPTSSWIEVKGILPISSLDSILETFQRLLDAEREMGIVDLDALWNPNEQPSVPLLKFDDQDDGLTKSSVIRGIGGGDENKSLQNWVEAAHVVLSPFGRPKGWHLKFRNRSIVNAILSHAQEHPIYDAWKELKISEWIPPHKGQNKARHDRDNAGNPSSSREDSRSSLVVTDSMIRIESCPDSLTAEDVMLMMSRYDLNPIGPSVQEWKGLTEDGMKQAPLMFVVHFADPSWARAAVRDLQSTEIDGKILRLAQYPRQMRVDADAISNSEISMEEAY